MKYVWILSLLILSVTFSTAQVKPIADGHEKFLGNIYSSAQLTGFTNYWNQVTPENAGKWGSVEGVRDQYNWSQLDNAYALAKDNGFPFKLHVLIWGNQQPSWIESLPSDEQLAEIIEWMDTLAARYPDIDYVEVVNEPLHDPPFGAGNGNYLTALGGTGSTGWDWIVKSFELARERFPNAKLLLNDYGIINDASKINTYLKIVNILKGKNLIDQLGIQCHAFNVNDLAAETITSNLNLLGSAGIPIYVTELDIDGETDDKQLERYKRVFPALWENEHVKGITLWGFRSGMWRTAEKAYLINTDGTTERPALQWLREYVYYTIPGNITGLEDENEFKLYPNPVTSGEFTLQGIESMKSIKIRDLQGNVIQSFSINNESALQININQAPGIYFVELGNGRNVTYKKFVLN